MAEEIVNKAKFCPCCGSNDLKEAKSFHTKEAKECVKCRHRFAVIDREAPKEEA